MAYPVHTSHRPRPGPARENTWAASWAGLSGPHNAHISWTAARPDPSNFRVLGCGPAQPITLSIFHGPTRLGPLFFKILGPARPITFKNYSARPGPAHQFFFDRPGPARSGSPAYDKPFGTYLCQVRGMYKHQVRIEYATDTATKKTPISGKPKYLPGTWYRKKKKSRLRI